MIEAEIVPPQGPLLRLMLAPIEPAWGLYEAVWTPTYPGTHRIKLRHAESGREVEGAIEITEAALERRGEAARPEVMREIAAVGGGRTGLAEDADALLAEIRMLPTREPMEQRVRLWCHPAWGGIIGVLMAAYWCGRKLAGKL